MILISNDLTIDEVNSYSRGDERVLAIQFSVEDTSYFCVNVYSPTKGSEKDKLYKLLNVCRVKRIKHSKDVLLVVVTIIVFRIVNKLDTFDIYLFTTKF